MWGGSEQVWGRNQGKDWLHYPTSFHTSHTSHTFAMQVVGLAEHVLGYVTIGATVLLPLSPQYCLQCLTYFHTSHVSHTSACRWWGRRSTC